MEAITHQAYLNEFKGNLFEFLTAQNMASHYGILSTFHKELDANLITLFQKYEAWIRENDPNLLMQLHNLSNDFYESLCGEFTELSSIKICGKNTAISGGDNHWKEADLIVESRDGVTPISLKMCKDKSFVNTKSGGVKSFFDKYFSDFSIDQNELNQKIAVLFDSFARTLHERHDLEYDQHFKTWNEAQLPTLPGELNEEDSKLIRNLYVDIATLFQMHFLEMYQSDAEKFIKALGPLMGFGRDDMLSAICFHSGTKKTTYKGAVIDRLNPATAVEIESAVLERGYFEIRFPHKVLQIRIKPMNRFTAASFKVNCSVKYH